MAALLALERALKKRLPRSERLRIAAEVGSDVPLFLVGGTALGVGRGEAVFPLADLPAVPCVIATPEIGVSTAESVCGLGFVDEKAGQAGTPAPATRKIDGEGPPIELKGSAVRCLPG